MAYKTSDERKWEYIKKYTNAHKCECIYGLLDELWREESPTIRLTAYYNILDDFDNFKHVVQQNNLTFSFMKDSPNYSPSMDPCTIDEKKLEEEFRIPKDASPIQEFETTVKAAFWGNRVSKLCKIYKSHILEEGGRYSQDNQKYHQLYNEILKEEPVEGVPSIQNFIKTNFDESVEWADKKALEKQFKSKYVTGKDFDYERFSRFVMTKHAQTLLYEYKDYDMKKIFEKYSQIKDTPGCEGIQVFKFLEGNVKKTESHEMTAKMNERDMTLISVVLDGYNAPVKLHYNPSFIKDLIRQFGDIPDKNVTYPFNPAIIYKMDPEKAQEFCKHNLNIKNDEQYDVWHGTYNYIMNCKKHVGVKKREMLERENEKSKKEIVETKMLNTKGNKTKKAVTKSKIVDSEENKAKKYAGEKGKIGKLLEKYKLLENRTADAETHIAALSTKGIMEFKKIKGKGVEVNLLEDLENQIINCEIDQNGNKSAKSVEKIKVIIKMIEIRQKEIADLEKRKKEIDLQIKKCQEKAKQQKTEKNKTEER